MQVKERVHVLRVFLQLIKEQICKLQRGILLEMLKNETLALYPSVHISLLCSCGYLCYRSDAHDCIAALFNFVPLLGIA